MDRFAIFVDAGYLYAEGVSSVMRLRTGLKLE